MCFDKSVQYNILNMPSRDEINTYLFKRNFHKDLAACIEENYGIIPVFTNTISWGYQTTAVYIETSGAKYIAKLTIPSEERISALAKDISVSAILNKALPTPVYLKNKRTNYLTNFQEYVMRMQYFIEGMPPFDMNDDILRQMIEAMKIIHVQDAAGIHLSKHANPKNEYKFLHGDLTPSNVLVSYGKLSGILDFDLAALGPVEWDISRTAVFCWFRMQDMSFKEVLRQAVEFYGAKSLREDLLLEYAKTHVNSHAENIFLHKDNYRDLNEWAKEYEFAQNASREILR